MRALRIAWIALALGFLFYFLLSRWSSVVDLLGSLALWQPAAALLLLIAGKLLYGEVVRLTLTALGVEGGFGKAFYAYSISQIGKYIPGSIWQFVGRYDIYRRYGLQSARAVELLVLENALLLATAIFVGSGAAVVIGAPLLALLPPIGWLAVLTLGGGVIVAVLVVVPRLAARAVALAGTLWRNRRVVTRIVALFLGLWPAMGLSAYMLFATEANLSPIFVASLFALSYAVGFVAVFAPAGIGVREAVFTLGLVGVVAPETALLLVVAHRILYVVADLVCAGGALVAITLGSTIAGPGAQSDPGSNNCGTRDT